MADQPPPRQLILTLYGLYAREDGGWLSVASLVRLLAELDVVEPAVRSSVSRLKRRGLVRSATVNGTAGYVLSPTGLEIIRAGDTRIFDQRRASIDDGWLLVVFSVPEADRDKRHRLRTQLTRLGFGTATPGAWIAPAHLHEETVRALDREGLRGYVDVFEARHRAFDALPSKVASWWDLDRIQRSYADFLDRYRPAWRRLSRRRALTAAQAFVAYVPALTAWRRLPYLDPGLPAELLPRSWNGTKAAELFTALDALLRAPAAEYAHRLIAG